MKNKPTTLGEKLASEIPNANRGAFYKFMSATLRVIINIILLTTILAVPMLWFMVLPDMTQVSQVIDFNVVLGIWLALVGYWLFFNRKRRSPPKHDLLAHDQQGFMRSLQLDQKAVVFDGNNIFHFGHEHGAGAQPLKHLVRQLRDQGYRVICFFDANIFFTLAEHNTVSTGNRHDLSILRHLFGLKKNEIYIVPSGTQADKYILDTLDNLPKSFAVTNDRFRDYAQQYASVMTSDQWRKGVVISGDELKLLRHQFHRKIKLEKGVGTPRNRLAI